MKTQTPVPNARRIQESLLAPLERRCLLWMAARLPDRVNSDHLTLIGFLSLGLAGLAYYLSQWNPLCLHAVNLFILTNWFGDSLDGTLARYRNRQRPRYGYYVDHILDSFGAILIVSGLALSGYMSERIALAFLVALFLALINTFLMTHVLDEFRISFWKLSPTELRLVLIGGNLFLFSRPHVTVLGTAYPLFDIGAMVGIVVLTVVVVASSLLTIRKLYLLEPL